jgi:hypothetical protein
MTREYVRAKANGARLTWEEKHPTCYVYTSPPELELLKEIVRTEEQRSAAREKPLQREPQREE